MTDERPRDLTVFEDLEQAGAWRVEWFDSDGAGYIAVFVGQSAEERARDYHDAIAHRRLTTRIANAQRGASRVIKLVRE
jgi:hypothetical protein